ncbi:MAG: hydantoinase B/oxoprolinase family protein [Actinobacteria bacterium]|nr:hydantoinase B/oxoprolinase family protein [Actinomycetota bacterium]
MTKNIDIITLSVIQNALCSISDEMSAALINTAYSTNIKDRRDCSCAIYKLNGEVIAQSEIGTPLHLGVMPAVVKTILNKFKISEIEPGDCIIMNEPYPAGPGHLNDITILSPVYFKDKMVVMVANQAHHVDVGGYAPGSMPFGVSEIYQEGLQIPPVKIVKKNKIDEEIMSIITDNVRTKIECRGDLLAQIAANNVGIKRIIELINKYGEKCLFEYIDEILNYSERRIKKGIETLPKGSYSFEDFIEGDGFTDDLIRIKATVEIHDNEIWVNFSGTSNQVKGPVNSRPPAVSACVYYVIKSILDPELPPNSGAYRPIKVIIPEGTLLNSIFPASIVHSNINTSQRIVDVLLGAFKQIVPERIVAACSGSQNLLIIGGIDPKNGKPYTYIETYGGGQGAMHNQDGMDAVHTHMTNTRNAPVEVIETFYPLLIEKYGIVKDSSGSGKFRGGSGLIRKIINLGNDATITFSSDRKKIKPWGVFKGMDGSGSNFHVIAKNGTIKKLSSKITTTLHNGEEVVSITPGGGGWGSPLERDIEKIIKDAIDGFISLKKAKDDYGVVLNPKTYKLDIKATKKLREENNLNL